MGEFSAETLDVRDKAASAPSISLPSGGGAVRGMGEKFAANPVTGTGSMTVPIATSPGRAGFGPQLSLSYDSGAGNGPFGFGWSLSLRSITRKTDKGLPKYQDADGSDVFILSGAEDLVPVLVEVNGQRQRDSAERTVHGVNYVVQRYRPRTEGLFARIERWTNSQTGEMHWRSISRDNITTLYGKTLESRIADPADPTRVFDWLICESRDDKGNAIVYQYKNENSDGVNLSQYHEKNRTQSSRSAGRYIKRILYGNRVSTLVEPDLSQADWMFEAVFDYGEHDADNPTPTDSSLWLCRHDPFSEHRAGFEVRTYRLCQRVLMFHHFPGETTVGQNCLVRSTDFVYRDIRDNPDDFKKGHPIASFVAAVTQSGYTRKMGGGFDKKSLPPLEFDYSQAEIQANIREIDTGSLENLPYGVDGSSYQWMDLDKEGISGIFTEQAEGWYFKRNMSPINRVRENGTERIVARFEHVELVASKPAATIASGAQFMDLAGDGQMDLVQLGGPTPGFYERADESGWAPFRPFISWPNRDMGDPNLKFIDLNGDGHSDILISEDEVFSWHASLAESGFSAAENVGKPHDEERGPRLVFGDATQSIYLADMSGDGLTDLVRIRNGELCYWPNLGYGRFGAKVTMDRSPRFDHDERFDRRRVRLGDIDGSGTTDIFYLGYDGVDIWHNESGNAWSKPRRLNVPAPATSPASVSVVDLLGNGTACLVWSSPLPNDAGRRMCYIDLMGGQKPHLLISVKNNLGAETHVHYVPSTRFYLEDKLAGQPWITRLPFPVHVVERVESYDRISRNRFVSRYAYHHGYFDGVEREFRGFGMVEQRDTEKFASHDGGVFPNGDNVNSATHVPPVLTKTWFHTGAFVKGGRISKQFESEYYREGDASLGESGLTDDQLRAMLLPDTVLPDDLTAEEAREACRALKGSILRQEVYGLDETQEADRPYSVSERNYTVKRLQPHGDNRHAVFFTHPSESIDFHYERKLFDINGQKRADPRISHSMTLAVNDFGNVLQSVAIGYGRRHDDPDAVLTDADRAKQNGEHVTYTENGYTNAVLQEEDYRTPLPSDTRTHELINVAPAANQPNVTNLFRFDEIRTLVAAAGDGQHDLHYEDVNAAGAVQNAPYRRLIEHLCTLYRRNDLTGPSPKGSVESLALPFESYKLAFTTGLLANVFRRGQENLLPNPANVLAGTGADRGGYVELGNDGNWWIPSGRVSYSEDDNHSPVEELAYARQHFFLPHRFRDPFAQVTKVGYDNYDLLPVQSSDPVQNVIRSENDYRVLQPALVTDPNSNQTAAKFDRLGLVVATAILEMGDSVDNVNADLDQSDIGAFFDAPENEAGSLLKEATTRIVYDVDSYYRTGDPDRPPFAATIARELHVGQAQSGTPVQVSFSYSDGFGREIQKKIQAESGPVVENCPEVDPRWVGSGWTIFNNKGKPVRQFEPFFSKLAERRHQFEFGNQVGVSPYLFYDPVGRVVATLHPNHVWEKVVFDPWRQETWDVNDTATLDPRNDEDVKGFFVKADGQSRLPTAEYLPTWYRTRIDPNESLDVWPGNDPVSVRQRADEKKAAEKAAVHAHTPTVAYFDSLGRTFLTGARNRFEHEKPSGAKETIEDKYATRVNLDIEGNQREVIDAKGRAVMRYDYDMLGNRIHQSSMEAGERWTLGDVGGQPIRAWDSRGHEFKTEYDLLRRPLNRWVRGTDAAHSDSRTLNVDLMFEKIEYGEGQPNDSSRNLRMRLYKSYDNTGMVTSDRYDVKGNPIHAERRLSKDYKGIPDWSQPREPQLETETFTSRTRFGALNRPIQLVAPHSDKATAKFNIIQPVYNEANLLDKLDVWLQADSEPDPADPLLDPATTSFHPVTNIDYNAKGQRTQIDYGNGVTTKYDYDPKTFRLLHMSTCRPGSSLQSLHYTYDPVGNITSIRDDAQQTIYFNGQVVEPHNQYTYDAIYRLITAHGREHIGQAGLPTPPSPYDQFRKNLAHPHDGQAMRRYTETYEYDQVGNFINMIHAAANGNWTRAYSYTETSQLEANNVSNRLTSTTILGETEPYGYDPHGNMLDMPHLSLMQWDCRDQLQATSRQVVNNGGTAATTHYVYDTDGQRVRKITERGGTRKLERIYLGGFEVYREYELDGTTISLERKTLHVMDDQQRVALVEMRTVGDDGTPKELVRYQHGPHLGSVLLELDAQALPITYEEYYAYGGTSYQAVLSDIESPLKRYRYSGKECDTETGCYYYGVRLYMPWLARWLSCDPSGVIDGPQLYAFVLNNPITNKDLLGRETTRDLHEARLDSFGIHDDKNFTNTWRHTENEKVSFMIVGTGVKDGDTFMQNMLKNAKDNKWVIVHAEHALDAYQLLRQYKKQRGIEINNVLIASHGGVSRASFDVGNREYFTKAGMISAKSTPGLSPRVERFFSLYSTLDIQGDIILSACFAGGDFNKGAELTERLAKLTGEAVIAHQSWSYAGTPGMNPSADETNMDRSHLSMILPTGEQNAWRSVSKYKGALANLGETTVTTSSGDVSERGPIYLNDDGTYGFMGIDEVKDLIEKQKRKTEGGIPLDKGGIPIGWKPRTTTGR